MTIAADGAGGIAGGHAAAITPHQPADIIPTGYIGVLHAQVFDLTAGADITG